MKHALIIGGSGMLANVTVWLAENGYGVSVIARNPDRLIKLAKRNINIKAINLDYFNVEALGAELEKAIQLNGPVETVVAWIHKEEEKIIKTIGNEINTNSNRTWKLFHVCGSSTSNKINFPINCIYHLVKLGFKIENNSSRWLNNDEISIGVIESIKSGNPESIIGVLEPSDKKP